MKKLSEEAGLELIERLARLMELSDENPFKVRAFKKAVEILRQEKGWSEKIKDESLLEVSGIGKGIFGVLSEWAEKGEVALIGELEAKLPKGLEELIEAPGVGPKKARWLIEHLNIDSLGELEYACRENRLTEAPGFGVKSQEKLIQYFQFKSMTRGMMRLCDALPFEGKILNALRKALGPSVRVEASGELRRRLEVVTGLDFLMGSADPKIKKKAEEVAGNEEFQELKENLKLHFCEGSEFEWNWLKGTSTPEHWKALGEPKVSNQTEKDHYQKLKISWISPEQREDARSVVLAKEGKLGEVLTGVDAVKGVFHNHTTRSDGANSLEEMVVAAKKKGFQYIGISDHSQSAFYAKGLKKEDLLEQEKEIRKCQERHPEIRIFWGVESDILQDGSLDYPDSILKRFDFVVASVHQRFQMDKKQMTDRIVNAIRHPATRWVGHLTGRLLLGRQGYELDFEKIALEASKHDVAIELNCNPARLDLDWRHGPLFISHGVKTAVSPDAHETEGLNDIEYGVWMARKALYPSSLVVNSWSAKEVEKWLQRK